MLQILDLITKVLNQKKKKNDRKKFDGKKRLVRSSIISFLQCIFQIITNLSWRTISGNAMDASDDTPVEAYSDSDVQIDRQI